MTEAQIAAWQAQHGGKGENSPSPPDTQGLVTHRAADGAWLVVGPSGVVSHGSSPGNVDTGPLDAPAKTGLGTYTQAELEARVAKNPNLVYQGQSTKTVTDPYTHVGTPVTVVSWLDPKTKEAVTAEVGTDGTYNVTKDAPGGPPAATAASQTAAPGGAAFKDDGPEVGTAGRRWGWNPDTKLYDRNLGPSPAAQTATQGTSGESRVPVDTHPGWTKVTRKTVQGGNSVETSTYIGPDGKEVPTLPTLAGGGNLSVPVPGHPGLSYVTTKVPATATTPESQTYHYEDSTGKTVPPPADAPTYTTRVDPVNGQQHVTIIATPKDGSPPTITHFGPDGKPEASLPTEGGGNQGPPLPHLVLGQVQDGLRIYREQLNQQVQAGTISPEVATKRWGEATQMSEMAIKEAQIAQNDIESRRNADVNIRTNALSNSTSGFNSALDFVSKLNGRLPQGSSAGANALIGILGLQRIQAREMGAFDNTFSNARVAPPPYSAPAGSPAAPAALAPNPSVPAQPAPTVTGAGPSTPGAPAVEAANTAINTAGADPSGANVQAANIATTAATGAAMGALGIPPASGAPAAPVATSGQPDLSTLRVVPDAMGGPPTYVAPDGSMYTRNGSGQFLTTGSNPNAYGSATAPAQPLAPAPVPVNPAAGEPGNDPTKPISMAQPGGSEQFTALPTFNPTPSPVTPGLAPPDAGPDMLALQRARIAATPPWRLSPEDLAYAQQNGLMNEAAQIPGVAA